MDVDTGTWSLPVFVAQSSRKMVPIGDHLYFASTGGLRRLPKSLWPVNMKADPLAPPSLTVSNTLYGQAARALFDLDYAKARALLTEAADQGIEMKWTRRAIQRLADLEAKTQKDGASTNGPSEGLHGKP